MDVTCLPSRLSVPDRSIAEAIASRPGDHARPEIVSRTIEPRNGAGSSRKASDPRSRRPLFLTLLSGNESFLPALLDPHPASPSILPTDPFDAFPDHPPAGRPSGGRRHRRRADGAAAAFAPAQRRPQRLGGVLRSRRRAAQPHPGRRRRVPLLGRAPQPRARRAAVRALDRPAPARRRPVGSVDARRPTRAGQPRDHQDGLADAAGAGAQPVHAPRVDGAAVPGHAGVLGERPLHARHAAVLVWPARRRGAHAAGVRRPLPAAAGRAVDAGAGPGLVGEDGQRAGRTRPRS
jgi:hypothetical protein